MTGREPASAPASAQYIERQRERWAADAQLLQEVLDRPAAERSAYLAAACPDRAARAAVEALLVAHESRGAVDALMDGVMAPLLARDPGPGEPAASEVTAPEPKLPPGVDARYRVLARLGGGGMGVVYRARDERLERDVALKFLPPHLSADEAAKKRFVLEARAAAALEHPNICTVHEIGETGDGQLYIVMACYDGETLERRIARGPLPVDEAVRIGAEVARGLAKAHERGIVHRDIKPANIVLTADGLVKMLDFGIAKLVDAGVTQTVGAIGTVAYMSPEQAFGEAVDHRTDIWSLGVVLYEMLTGVRPFRGPGEQAVLYGILTSDPEPTATLRAGVPPRLDAVLRRALAKQPAERFATAAELAAALLSAGAAAGGGDGAAAPVADATAQESPLTRGGERRQVTVVAFEVVGYERVMERLAPDEADQVLAQLRAAAAEVATQFGAIVNHFLGDEFVMLFGVPTAHEDDTVRAVRAALALHARTAALAVTTARDARTELRLRTGIHVGAAVAQRLRAGDRRYRIAGPPADVAARLAAAADPGAVILSPEARRLTARVVETVEALPVPIRFDGATVVPHRVLGLVDARESQADVPDVALTPFVGRERERAMLADHLASATAGVGRATAVIGEAGAGKSRLSHEIRALAAERGVRVIVGRCDRYGDTTPFGPFVEAASEALAVPRHGTVPERHDAVVAAVHAMDASLEDALPLYLALLAIPSVAHPVPEHLRGELFQAAMLDAVAALFTVGARATPMLLLLEDWHWADEASRAALRRLAEIVPAYALLLVVTARPEASFDWGSADHQMVLHLSPLDDAATAGIARAVLGVQRVAPGLVARLHERTGGNPFFLEEVCEALREEGALTVRDGEAVSADASGAVHVPETVQGVLRTRMDRLDDAARDVLRIAAVVGREFTRGVLEAVGASDGSLPRALERLKASGLVQQIGVVPEPLYRFKHALTQEVAYDSLLEHQRASLHAAVGRAIESRYAARLDEHAERLAHHFSEAEAWPEAVRYGVRAADRAASLSQHADALGTLERVEGWVVRLPEGAERRDLHADVLLRQERLCELLGLRHRQLELAESLIGLLAPHGPSERLAHAYLRQGDAFTLLHRFEAAERALATALRIARERRDSAGERNALRSITLLRSFQGRHEEALAHIEQVLALGRAAGDAKAEAGDLASVANILRAMGQPERALAVLQEALERTVAADNPVRYSALLNVIGTVHRDLGDYDTALQYFHRVQQTEQRHPVNVSFALPYIADIQLRQGCVEEALATYRQAVELNRRARYADGCANVARSLGEVLVGLGRDEEALPYLREAAALFAQLGDAGSEAQVRRRLASLCERLRQPADARGEWERARDLARGSAELPAVAEALEGIARTARQLSAPPATVAALYEEALALAIRVGDRKRELAVRNSLGIGCWQQGDFEGAVRHYEAALRLCRALDDRIHEGLILNSLGATLHRLRRWDEARTVLADSIRVTEASGERRLRAHALATLGAVCLDSGRLDEARACVESSLALRRELGDRRGEGWMQEHLARVCVAQRAPNDAAAAAAAAAAIAEELGDAALRAAAESLQPQGTFRDSSHP